MRDTMTERPDRCTMIGQPWSFDLAGYFVDFVRNDGHWGIRQRRYAPSQPSAFSRSSTQERSTFPAMVAALVFSSARSLALAAA
jgi:hypothetical protein